MLINRYLTLFTILLLVSAKAFSQNETCATATEIINNATYQSNGPNTGSGCHHCEGATHADWYKFTAPESGLLDISSCAFFGPNTNLWVYSGDCSNLQLIDNDSNSCGGFFGNAAVINQMVVNSGTTYFLEWDNAFDSSAFAFEFTFTPFSSENCNNPVRFNADSVSSTSAYLSWQSVENGSDFTIEYGPFGFALGSGDKVTGTVGVDGPPVELTGLTDGTFYQAYLYESCQTKGNTDTLDVFFRTDFACRTARAFTFNEDSIAPDFVRIDWTSFNEGSTFHLEYGLAGFAFGSGTRISGIVGTDGPPVSIAGLTERTEYDYYYFESCSEGNSDTLGAFNFTTTAFCPDPDNIVMSSQSDSTVSIDWDSDNNSTFTIEAQVLLLELELKLLEILPTNQ